MTSLEFAQLLMSLPDIPEKAPLTTRGRTAWMVNLAVRRGATEEDVARHLGLNIEQVRRLRSYAKKRIVDRIGTGQWRHCQVCGKRLAIDARSDARYCFTPSTCRKKMAAQRVLLRRSYRGRWSTSRSRPTRSA